MLTQQIKLFFGKFSRQSYTNLILMIFSILYLPTLIIPIPSIISLIQYKKYQNHNTCFQKFTAIYIYIIGLFTIGILSYFTFTFIFFYYENYEICDSTDIYLTSLLILFTLMYFWYCNNLEFYLKLVYEKEGDEDKKVEMTDDIEINTQTS